MNRSPILLTDLSYDGLLASKVIISNYVHIIIISFDASKPPYWSLVDMLLHVQGTRYVTPDEVKCTSFPLTGKLERLCVPPTGAVSYTHLTLPTTILV